MCGPPSRALTSCFALVTPREGSVVVVKIPSPLAFEKEREREGTIYTAPILLLRARAAMHRLYIYLTK